jgi:FAD/FMN-containing dehydrogenase
MPGEFGQIASYAVGVKMVLPDGTLFEVDESDPELLQVCRSSYGLFGILYEATFRVRKLAAMQVHHEKFSLDEFEAALPDSNRRCCRRSSGRDCATTWSPISANGSRRRRPADLLSQPVPRVGARKIPHAEAHAPARTPRRLLRRAAALPRRQPARTESPQGLRTRVSAGGGPYYRRNPGVVDVLRVSRCPGRRHRAGRRDR